MSEVENWGKQLVVADKMVLKHKAHASMLSAPLVYPHKSWLHYRITHLYENTFFKISYKPSFIAVVHRDWSHRESIVTEIVKLCKSVCVCVPFYILLDKYDIMQFTPHVTDACE